MDVRKMVLEDSEAVYTLSKQCFSEPWSLESIQKEVVNPVASYFVVEETNGLMGYGGLWHVLDEGDVINIAVTPDKRRRGVGDLILETLLNEARKLKLVVVHLEVRKSNQAAFNLYKKHGFNQIALRKGYYHHPLEDAVIMECLL